MALKAVVVDDTILYRRIVSDALSLIPDVEIVGTAPNGRIAVERILALAPDMVTLDLEMPGMGGLEVLDALRAAYVTPSVVVVSALTTRGGALTIQALDKGAFDFVTKPDGGTVQQNRTAIHEALAPIVAAIGRYRRTGLRSASAPARTAVSARPSAPVAPRPARVPLPGKRPELVLIGVSTGGPPALGRLLSELPGNLGVPVVVVQHMPPLFTRSLAESLDKKCALAVREAAHGTPLEPNVVYIAPGGSQMLLATDAGGRRVARLSDDPPENHCKPAVDYLFRSVAREFPGCSMAVIMTGMGSDGTAGLRLLRRHGCFTIAQDEASSVVYGMNRSAVEAGVVDAVVPLDGIATRIVATVRGCQV